MTNNNHIEASKPTSPGDSARSRPSERLLNTASDLFRGVGQEGSAKAVDAFSAMSQKLLSNKAVGEIFGNLSIVDKQGNAVAPFNSRTADSPAKSGSENRPALSAAEAEALRFGQGDKDAREHVGYSPTQLASKLTDKVKVFDHVASENTLITARTSTLSQTERTRLAAQLEKKQSAEKSKAKRERSKIGKGSSDKVSTKAEQNTGKHELSSTRDSKLEKVGGERGSSKAAKQSEQQAPRAQQQSHRTEQKGHTPEQQAHTPGQQSHEETVKHPAQVAQHDHEITAKHQASSARHNHETTAKQPQPEAQNNREVAAKHPEPARQNNHEVVKHQEPSVQHDRDKSAQKDKAPSDRINNKQNPEPPKEAVATRRLDRSIPTQQPDKITTSQRPEKQTTPARMRKSQEALLTSTPPPIKTLESATTRQISAEIAHKQAPPLTIKQETTEKVARQTQLLATNTEKGTDKSSETISAIRNQSASKQLTEEKIQLTRQEPDNERGTADRADNTIAPVQRDNKISDWADVNHNNGEFLIKQDHAPGATDHNAGSPVHNHSTSDLSHTTLAKSAHPTSNHIESNSKVHTINHIVSSLSGRSGKTDSVRITPEPELANKNKNTAGGTSTSAKASTPGSARSDPDHHGHTGQHPSTGHGTSTPVNSGNNSQPGSSTQSTNKQTTSANGQNTASSQTGTTASAAYGGPIIIEPSSSNRDRAAYLFELFAEIAFMAGMDSPARRVTINSRLGDITNPAIPGNIFAMQPNANQPSNPSNWQSVEPNAPQPNLPDSLSPVYTLAPSTQNPAAENNLGLSLNPLVSEPSTSAGKGLVGQIPTGANGNGLEAQSPFGPNGTDFAAKGDPTVNPTLSDPGIGQLGNNPTPNGSPYLSGSVDYWGDNPESASANPGVGPNANTALPDEGFNNGSPSSGQPNHSGHLEPENAQPGYAALSGEISQKNDGNNHDKEREHSRPEIADAWQTSHHLHEQGTTVHDNGLDHKHGQSRHDLSANDPWQEQNHGRKHAHTHKGAEPNHNNNRLPDTKIDFLIGQLMGLIADTKNNKDPKQQPPTYVVKAGDTLESIASDILFDFRLGLLIYIINKTILPTQSDWRQCKLREGTVLFLPEEAEIRSFRMAMIEKEKQDGTLISLPVDDEIINKPHEQEAIERLTNRRMNIERLLGSLSNASSAIAKSISEREQVTVRLGDTLRSIALKHASLHDVSLWKLLAQLNELSCAVDAKGVPTAVLTRGMTLQLPTAAEIAEYRTNQAQSTRALSPRKALQAEVLMS